MDLGIGLDLVDDYNFVHYIALFDLVDDINAFEYFSKDRMIAIQVFCVVAAVADKELGATGIASGMGHGEDPFVVVLILAREFTVDLVPGAAAASTLGAAALDDEVGNHAVKGEAVVISFGGKVEEVLYRIRSILLVKLDLHYTSCCMDLCDFHSRKCSL